MEEISQQYTLLEWSMSALAILLLGISKAGIKGIDILIVTLMVYVFGAKPSSGILLLLLSVADVLAVIYYRRHIKWEHFWKLIPWMIIGILIGVLVGREIDEAYFKKLMSSIIVISVLIMLWQELKKDIQLQENKLLAKVLGLSAGFTTMIGNLAGPFANLYFLLVKFDKNAFIGTAAWIFLFINLFKIPFHIFFWETISNETLGIDVFLLPFLVVGFYIGIKVVNKINNENYRKMIIALTLLGAILILLN